jgi:hydroxymethylglutaryl-CoA lyase
VTPARPHRVIIREVGPRDGLQAEDPLSVDDRARLIEALSATGVPKIEAVSFVSPKAVPAMADAGAVWARARRVPEVAYSALVPNRRGAEAAIQAGGFASLQAFVAAADGYSLKNVGKTVEDSLVDMREVIDAGTEANVPVEVTISVVFGDPYEGEVPADRVVALAEQLAEAGAEGISLGDTTGVGTPASIAGLVGPLRERLPGVRLNLHLHDTNRTALSNALAAVDLGVTEFDTAVGGLGGSPFTPRAGGNLATEHLVAALDERGVETGVEMVKLRDAARLAESLVGHALPSRASIAP